MTNDYYTWSEYVAEVKKLLPIEAQRKGVATATGDVAADYLTSLIRQAVIQLQRVIPGFQINHETVYHPQDLVREGAAMRGVKPPQSAFRDMTLTKVNDDATYCRFEAIGYPWPKRMDLVNAMVPTNDRRARFSIDPSGYTFYIYPVPTGECWLVSMFWDGQKLDFEDDDQVPFSEASALAVSYFVKANTSLEVEDGLQNSGAYMALFEAEKKKLYIDDKEKRGAR